MILVDADACPVKDEIYKVAFRVDMPVVLVANQYLRHPDHPLISMEVTGRGFDAADDRVAELSGPGVVVVTADILLAERCLDSGAAVISPKGEPFTENSIGAAVAVRAIMEDQRAGLGQTGGPSPFAKADRSRFLQALDLAVRRAQSRGKA